MEAKKQNEEVQSRREFFRQAAKKALPVIGAIALIGSPLIVKADTNNPSGCNNGCYYSCYNTCKTGCTGTCSSCNGRCASDCQNTCLGGCQGSCVGGCDGTCRGGCSSSNNMW